MLKKVIFYLLNSNTAKKMYINDSNKQFGLYTFMNIGRTLSTIINFNELEPLTSSELLYNINLDKDKEYEDREIAHFFMKIYYNICIVYGFPSNWYETMNIKSEDDFEDIEFLFYTYMSESTFWNILCKEFIKFGTIDNRIDIQRKLIFPLIKYYLKHYFNNLDQRLFSEDYWFCVNTEGKIYNSTNFLEDNFTEDERKILINAYNLQELLMFGWYDEVLGEWLDHEYDLFEDSDDDEDTNCEGSGSDEDEDMN